VKNLANFALFQLAWFACVMGAAAGNGWIGPLSTLPLVAAVLWVAPDRRCELRLLVTVAVVGTAIDSGLERAGVFRFAAPNVLAPVLVPAWISALWLAFAALLRHSLAWLAPYQLLAVLLGAVGGPLSSLAGHRMGALEYPGDRALSLAVIAAEWAVLTPLLLALAHRGRPPGTPTGDARPEPAGGHEKTAGPPSPAVVSVEPGSVARAPATGTPLPVASASSSKVYLHLTLTQTGT